LQAIQNLFPEFQLRFKFFNSFLLITRESHFFPRYLQCSRVLGSSGPWDEYLSTSCQPALRVNSAKLKVSFLLAVLFKLFVKLSAVVLDKDSTGVLSRTACLFTLKLEWSEIIFQIKLTET